MIYTILIPCWKECYIRVSHYNSTLIGHYNRQQLQVVFSSH